MKEAEEIALSNALEKLAGTASKLLAKGDYAGVLKTFAGIKPQVDAFFDKSVVMAEYKNLRFSCLSLLKDLSNAMNNFADISRLAK